MADKLQFELVSPERLVMSEPVDMVVIPGAEGNFGAMPRHSPLISALRTGVIDVYQGKTVSDRIFVAGGFAEVTPERCTVLAEQAVRVKDIDRASVERSLKDLREDESDAKTDQARQDVRARIAIAEAMLAAAA
ncbi:MAG: F0F1 ATP synthase subunit epsilon [Alphaproteobacteria bacterium]